MTGIRRFFVAWRTIVLNDREIIDAHVAEEHRGPSPQLAAALDEWPGAHYWAEAEGHGRLVLIRPTRAPQAERWWLHGLLFLLTFVTVWMGGAVVSHSTPDLRFTGSFEFTALLGMVGDWLRAMSPSLNFAMALMGILLAHELGHYFVARRYCINASPPYFLPAPPWINLIGTFGAFIRIRSPVVDRRQLMDVGAAGPWAGFLVALVVLTIGLMRSESLPGLGHDAYQVIIVRDSPLNFGGSLLLTGLREMLDIHGPILMHPLALAGWVGIFITMLNLLPLGQLDGGHVIYALMGNMQVWVGRVIWYVLLVLGFKFPAWWLWAGLTLLLGRGRIAHPSVLDRYRPIPVSRKPLGLATIVLFVVTFTPIPFHFV